MWHEQAVGVLSGPRPLHHPSTSKLSSALTIGFNYAYRVCEADVRDNLTHFVDHIDERGNMQVTFETFISNDAPQPADGVGSHRVEITQLLPLVVSR